MAPSPYLGIPTSLGGLHEKCLGELRLSPMGIDGDLDIEMVMVVVVVVVV